MKVTKKMSTVFATLLLVQTFATPTLSFAQETVLKAVPVQGEITGENGKVPWVLDSTGEKLTFTEGGNLTTPIEDMSELPTGTQIKEIVFTEKVSLPKDSSGFFASIYGNTMRSLEKFTNFEYVDASAVTDMSQMFFSTENLSEVVFGESFDASKVENMNYLFSYSSLEKVDFSKLKASSSLKTIVGMFYGAQNLKEVDFGEVFDTSKVAESDAKYMFHGVNNLKRITFGDNFKLKDSVSAELVDPDKEDPTYTGRWAATDRTVFHDTSAALLATGTEGKGPKTFVWEKQYTVTFKDADGTELAKSKVPHGDTAIAPEVLPVHEGMTFVGWDMSLENIVKDMTFTATYTDNKYMVTFVDYDGKVLGTPQEIMHGQFAVAPANPTRVGYTFDKWDMMFDNVKGNLTVKAMYKINQYTVTFKNSDGKVLKTEMVNHGNKATAPANPMRKDHTFAGWDKAFNNVTGHVSVTAKHTPIAVSFKTSVTSKTIGKKKSHTLSIKSLNVEKSRVEYTIAKGSESYASVNKTTGKVTTKDKAGTFKVNVKVIATNGTSKTMTVTYKTIHHVTDVLTDKGKKLATKASIKKGKTTTIKTKAISNKKTQKATSPKMTFATSNKKVATVDKKGKIKGVKKGTATITITTTTADGAKVVKKVKVTVK